MSLPRISIVTPCFNAEQFLEETINSVLSQNYPALQYIIVDGGSQDRSVEIIKKYEKYLDHWISEPDSGQSEAICKGLKLCDGDVFNWLNADDYYYPGTLDFVGHAFNDPICYVLAARSHIFGMGSARISAGTDIYKTLERTIGRARIDQPETFFRLSAIMEVGSVNPDFNYLMDRELWIRYLLNFGLENVRQTTKVLAAFRLHPVSKTVSAQDKFNKEQTQIEEALLQISNTNPSCKKLRQMLRDNKLKINLDKLKTEYCLHHYEMAYAQRNWDDMERWRTTLVSTLKRGGVNPSLIIANLECRKLICHTIERLKK